MVAIITGAASTPAASASTHPSSALRRLIAAIFAPRRFWSAVASCDRLLTRPFRRDTDCSKRSLTSHSRSPSRRSCCWRRSAGGRVLGCSGRCSRGGTCAACWRACQLRRAAAANVGSGASALAPLIGGSVAGVCRTSRPPRHALPPGARPCPRMHRRGCAAPACAPCVRALPSRCRSGLKCARCAVGRRPGWVCARCRGCGELCWAVLRLGGVDLHSVVLVRRIAQASKAPGKAAPSVLTRSVRAFGLRSACGFRASPLCRRCPVSSCVRTS